MLRSSRPLSEIKHDGACTKDKARRASCSASVWERNIAGRLEIVARDVEDVDVSKARRHHAMRDRGTLRRLALAAIHRAAQVIGRAVAQAVQRIPERLRLRLIGDEGEHLAEL